MGIIMGINLVPELTHIQFKTYYFRRTNSSGPAPTSRPIVSNGSVEEGCITEGEHRVLAFTTTVHNRGNESLIIGNPANRPDIYEPAPHMPEGWVMKERFYEYSLKDNTGTEISKGFKRAWCIQDHSTFTCGNQGISVGDHDEYRIDQNCQFLVIDREIIDGEYSLEAVINPSRVFKEDNYDDNKVTKKIKIEGRIVTPL
jgi:hypothetical protein